MPPYVFVVAGIDNALTIIDVANVLAPAFAGSIQGAGAPNFLGTALSVFIQGDYAYVASPADDALTIIDISNPLAPAFAGSIQGAGAPNFLAGADAVFVQGDYAYVASAGDDALTIIDISNPLAPAFAGSIQGTGAPNFLNYPRGVFVVGNFAYVAAYTDDALTIIDVTNPLAPAFAGSIQGAGAPNFLWNPGGVFVLGDYAYVGVAVDHALTVIDVANPLAPAFAGSIQGAGAPNFLNGAGPLQLIPLTAPTVQTDPATSIISNAASLNGTLDTGGLTCQCRFEWGETPAYGNITPIQNIAIDGSFAQTIYPLNPDTTYHFRAIATNDVGTSTGADRSFTTLQVPYHASLISLDVQTNDATLITEHTARLNGEVVEDGGVRGAVRFQWGLTTEYGNDTPWQQGYYKGDEFLIDLNNLAEGQGFHFRAQFRSEGKLVSGSDMVFNTLSPLGPVTLVTDEVIQLLEVV